MQCEIPQSPPARRNICRSLWKFGGLLAIFVGTFYVGNFFVAPDKAISRRAMGNDFLAFYFAGHCVITGQTQDLYDLGACRQFEQQVGHDADLDIGPAYGPWWNPPFAALMFAPLAMLPYKSAQTLWWIFDSCCLIVALFLLARTLKGDWKIRALVPLFVLTSMPFVQAFGHGQNTFFSLMLLTIAVTLWRGSKPLAAGIVCGLLFYKPQLGAVVAMVLCLCEGRQAILGVAITGTMLAVINVVFLPGTLHDWITRMPVNLTYMQEVSPYQWERHVTFKGLWRVAVQRGIPGPTAMSVKILWGFCEAIFLGGLAAVALNTVRNGVTPTSRDRLIAASILTMPLVMPFYFDYDLLLISVAMVVYAADRMRNPLDRNWEDSWFVGISCVMLVTLLFATPLASRIHVLLTIPLLAGAAAMLIRRGLRPIPKALSVFSEVPVRLAA
jgi:hypothetical protein